MRLVNKARNRFMMSRGRVRQAIGRIIRNRSMQRKGKAERFSGAARQVTEHAREAGRSIRDMARR